MDCDETNKVYGISLADRKKTLLVKPLTQYKETIMRKILQLRMSTAA